MAVCLAASILAVGGAGDARAQTAAAIDDALAVRRGEKASNWLILPYKPSYILPFTVFDDPNEQPIRDVDGERSQKEFDDVEVKFQISFMMPLWRDIPRVDADFFFGYTQVSFWQLYNSDESAPFRDTNYEPEGFLMFDTDFDVLGFNNRAISVGFVHQSNGRGNEDLTRSWNRIYASFLLERGDLALGLKPWLRVSDDEDNPRIDKYLGYGELRAVYKYEDHVFSAMFRNNFKIPDDNKSAVELAWSRSISKYLRGYVQYFYGYGESLLDYDYLNHRIGVGVMLNDWL